METGNEPGVRGPYKLSLIYDNGIEHWDQSKNRSQRSIHVDFFGTYFGWSPMTSYKVYKLLIAFWTFYSKSSQHLEQHPKRRLKLLAIEDFFFPKNKDSLLD